MKSLIDIENFSFSFGKTVILESISMTVHRGEYLSIIGPNGAGKSTLLKCLMRILPDGTGNITLNDKPLKHYRQKELAKLVSYVPQSDSRSIPFTVEEFVMMGRYPYLSPFTSFTNEDMKAVLNALALTETEYLSERHLNTLSGGERQTVCIAAALAQGAQVMLLDEPTTFLDPKHESTILKIISKINREHGITIILVTHNINSAVLHSDRIGILKKGHLVFLGDAEDIMDNEILEKVYDKPFSFVKHPATGASIIVPEVDVL